MKNCTATASCSLRKREGEPWRIGINMWSARSLSPSFVSVPHKHNCIMVSCRLMPLRGVGKAAQSLGRPGHCREEQAGWRRHLDVRNPLDSHARSLENPPMVLQIYILCNPLSKLPCSLATLRRLERQKTRRVHCTVGPIVHHAIAMPVSRLGASEIEGHAPFRSVDSDLDRPLPSSTRGMLFYSPCEQHCSIWGIKYCSWNAFGTPQLHIERSTKTNKSWFCEQSYDLLELMLLTSAALWPAQAEEMQSWQSLEELATKEKHPRSCWEKKKKQKQAPVVFYWHFQAFPSSATWKCVQLQVTWRGHFCHLLSKPFRAHRPCVHSLVFTWQLCV